MLATGAAATSGDMISPYQLTGYIPPAPTSGTGTTAPSNTAIVPPPPTFAPTAPASAGFTPGGGISAYPGPGEIITYSGGGGGLIVPTPPGVAPGTGQGNVPGTIATGVPGVPNSPTAPTTAYSSPTPNAAMPGAGFSLQSIPTWGWIAIAIGVLFLLKD